LEVTNPLGMNAPHAPSVPGFGIVARTILDKHAVSPDGQFEAQNLALVGKDVVAQASQQGGVEVRASISPNPTGTLLYGGCPAQPVGCSGVVIPVTAGTQTTVSCVYTISVDTTITNWSLDQGLYTDFENTSQVVSFSGTLLHNNSYLSTPLPQYTPFIVYSNGANWTLLQANGGMKTYCVNLQITVPTSVLTGDYSSNATYSLYY
jgi:hypothetical protein